MFSNFPNFGTMFSLFLNFYLGTIYPYGGNPPKVLGPTFAYNVVYLVDKELCCFGHTFGHKLGYD